MYVLTERQMQRLEEVARRLEVDEKMGKAERHMLATEMAWVLAGVLHNQRLPADEPAEVMEGVVVGHGARPAFYERRYAMTCTHDPRLLAGQPIGMYHCPECGDMVVAGLEHPEPMNEYGEALYDDDDV